MDGRRALLAALTAGILSVSLAAPAQADPAGPDLVGADLFDPVIKLLPPRPAPHAPYTGSMCPDGSPTCIEATIAEMKRRLAVQTAACDHDAIFGLAYLRVTEDVRKAVSQGWFSDRVWLGQVDAVFARLYFNSMDAWHAGERASIPRAWRIALQAADDRSMTGLGNFMLAMNAHINRDFSYVLAEVGLTAADGTSHKADHNAYNPRLDALMDPVFSEEAARFDPTFDDFAVAGVDALAAGTIMRGWREMVWRNAENLALAKGPLARKLAARTIEEYAATQALMIRASFASPSSAARDAWCTSHHG
jgi:hypothetical protein